MSSLLATPSDKLGLCLEGRPDRFPAAEAVPKPAIDGYPRLEATGIAALGTASAAGNLSAS